MIPKAIRKMVKNVKPVKFTVNIDIIYFLNEKGFITGKIDFTNKIIFGQYFKGFKIRR